MTTTLSAEELAKETRVSLDVLDWLQGIGILKPSQGKFAIADVFRVKLVAALLEAGFTTEQIEWVTSAGVLNLDRVDEYFPFDPGPRSERSFAEFISAAGPGAASLPSVYEILGLPRPDPAAPIHVNEERLLERFLEAWSLGRSDETLSRAARLIAEGTRTTTMGWIELADEQVAEPARERVYRGEIGRFPDEVRRTFSAVIRLLPRMMEWLGQRYVEQRSVAGIVEGFEEYFAAMGLAAPLAPTAPPAVVFVDLSGYTRLTEERGDEVALGFASTLQREAEAVASANGGRLVKLLGDGAMLRFPDAQRGLAGALALVRALREDGGLSAHAGVHAGPVIERDLDLYGRTVNLASRIAGVAGPGEVLVSEAVAAAVDDPTVRFEEAGGAALKGIAEPVKLFRVKNRGSG